MSEMLKEPVKDASAWVGAELQGRDDVIHRLSEPEIAELDRALRSVQESGLDTTSITRDDFVLPVFAATLRGMLNELNHGRGFLLIRGFPRERYSEEECARIYWGLGTHFGHGVSQDKRGSLLGHIRDAGQEITVENTVRGYQTRIALPYHTDGCDAAGLFCLETAMKGGASMLISSVTVHNRFLERRPDLIEELYRPFYYDRRGEIAPGQKPYRSCPIYTWHAGLLSCSYVRGYIQAAQRFPQVPRLTGRAREALDVLDQILDEPDLPLAFQLEPGDMEFANNYSILHSRSAFEDWPEPEKKRHLLRLWLAVYGARDLPDSFRRGGIRKSRGAA